jgi:hypothetical protein
LAISQMIKELMAATEIMSPLEREAAVNNFKKNT